MLRDSNTKGVLICGEERRGFIHSATMELIGKARELADKKKTEVTVLLCCGEMKEDPKELFSYGADTVLLAMDKRLTPFNQELESKILAQVIQRFTPEIVIAPATTAGRTYLPYVAAMVHTGLTADCTGLDIDEETGLLLQTRPAIGGNVIATITTPLHTPQMATVRPKTFRIPLPAKERRGKIIKYELDVDVLKSRIEVCGMEYSESNVSNIQDKDIILSGGKGLKKAANFAFLNELANLLNAGVGASRPAVEAKWIDYPHQVGLSGKVVAPKFYLAAGISGAIQHLAGMQTAQKIVAINKDPDATIFQIADIALCGDLNDILPRLTARIRKEIR